MNYDGKKKNRVSGMREIETVGLVVMEEEVV